MYICTYEKAIHSTRMYSDIMKYNKVINCQQNDGFFNYLKYTKRRLDVSTKGPSFRPKGDVSKLREVFLSISGSWRRRTHDFADIWRRCHAATWLSIINCIVTIYRWILAAVRPAGVRRLKRSVSRRRATTELGFPDPSQNTLTAPPTNLMSLFKFIILGWY